jgi:hypothetical protein
MDRASTPVSVRAVVLVVLPLQAWQEQPVSAIHSPGCTRSDCRSEGVRLLAG